MNIKKSLSNRSLETSLEQDNIKIILKEQGNLEVEVTSSVSNHKIDKPGEYGYGHSSFICLEDGVEEFKSQINLVNIVTPLNTSMLILNNRFSFSKEDFDKIVDPDVVISPVTDNKDLKNLIMKFQPEICVFVNFNADEKVIASLKNEYSFSEAPSGVLKIDEKELNTQEDPITAYYLL